MKKMIKYIFISLLVLIIAFVGIFFIYVNDYYHQQDVTLTVEEIEHTLKMADMTVIYPNDERDLKTIIIFYPGGKVEADAYLPLLYQLADEGVTAVLIKMPFNLAVFGIDKANQVFNKLPGYNHYYIAGHSLGGAMASQYAIKHQSQLSGLILLGAYPVTDIDLSTIQIYGSEDKVIDRKKLSNKVETIEIKGGNHAYFGNYGNQKGDGEATITRNEQQAFTVQTIIDFITSKE